MAPRYRKNVGDWGEDIAVGFLRRRKFEIVERNFHTPAGEIDIVAKYGGDYYAQYARQGEKSEKP